MQLSLDLVSVQTVFFFLFVAAGRRTQHHIIWFCPYTDLCKHFILGTFPEFCEKKSQAYLGGIRTHKTLPIQSRCLTNLTTKISRQLDPIYYQQVLQRFCILRLGINDIRFDGIDLFSFGSKLAASFQSMEVKNSAFAAFIDVFTSNTYVMVIMSDPTIREYS